MTRVRLWLVAALCGVCAPAWGELRVPHIIGPGMVLQREQPAPVWGWADAGQNVTVQFAQQSHQATADSAGRWKVTLTPMPASAEPRTLTVASAGRTLTFDNVLVGEVWLCSGQSNMQFVTANALNAEAELARADWPRIRLFTTPAVFSHLPQDDVDAQWQQCSAATARYFSAVGFFFGRQLHEDLDVPVGLISSSWGGTRAELWMPLEALRLAGADQPRVMKQVEQVDDVRQNLPALKEAFERNQQKYKDELKQLAALAADADDAAKMADPALDDAAWPAMKVPLRWNLTRGVGTLEGMIWHRIAVTLPADWAGRNLQLRLGPIDEIDMAYFNGQRVGGEGSVDAPDSALPRRPRVYDVPGDRVVAGRNVLAVGVINLADAGGIHGGKAEDLQLALKDDPRQSIPLAGTWKYQIRFRLNRPDAPVTSRLPTALYNAKIHPLIPYSIRGVIWYQGESNAGGPDEYAVLLRRLIEGWRSAWGQERLHFGIVQLANLGAPLPDKPEGTGRWAELRAAQAEVAQSMPDTGLAVAIDVGDANDIHPRDKQSVARRLANWALATTCGRDVPYRGPTLRAIEADNGALRIHFDYLHGGLVFRGDHNQAFALAGPDGKYVWADAQIDGGTVVVRSPQVPAPMHVRYAWQMNPPQAPLYNKAGLPAVPFSGAVPASRGQAP